MATEEQHHHLKIQGPQGKDALAIEHLRVSEGLSRLFEIHVRFIANKRLSDLEGQVGQAVSISLTLSGQSESEARYFHGHIASIGELGKPLHNSEGQRYEARVVPRAWSARNRSNCRIFQEETALDIAETVLGEHEVELVRSIEGTPRNYRYCVQYNETDWDFVTRLLAHEGLFFFFEHSESGHRMVVGDNVNAYQPALEDSVIYRSGDSGDSRIYQWRQDHRAGPDALVEQGFDFTRPGETVADSGKASIPGEAFGEQEIFHYIGEDRLLINDSEPLAATHLKGLNREAQVYHGASDYLSFGAGLTFSFREHEDGVSSSTGFVITRFECSASVPVNSEDGDSGESSHYTNTFECIATDKPFVPARQPKPVIPGVQTATVTTGPGEELHVDEYGRVRVQFHWDREGKNNPDSSCWIRVAQGWAGAGFGAQFLPRQGQEVVVEFINGDPDQPLVTGSVYNDDNPLPYSTDKQLNSSGIRSRSTLEGGEANYSEIRFDDDKGKELLVLHAEKDHELTVENDETDSVGNNRQTEIGNDDKLKVGNNQNATIGGDRTSETSGSDTIKAGKTITVDAGTSITLQTGAASITLESSGNIAIEGTQISLDGATISLKGANISLN